jgi:hypothetical protein
VRTIAFCVPRLTVRDRPRSSPSRSTSRRSRRAARCARPTGMSTTLGPSTRSAWRPPVWKMAPRSVRALESLHRRTHPSADSHFCYSDFASMFDHIERLDTDVLSIESSKGSKLEMFAKSNYPRFIGPGVYDVSLRAEILTRLTRLTRSTRELSESCAQTSLTREQSPSAAAAGNARPDCRCRQADAGRPLRRQPGLRPQDKRLEGDRGQSDQHG